MELIITAASANTAKTSNEAADVIVVSVTDANGNPITGLTKANFGVKHEVPGTVGVNLLSASPSSATPPNPGVYHLFIAVKPAWKTGTYVFVVTVSTIREIHAQCVCNVIVP